MAENEPIAATTPANETTPAEQAAPVESESTEIGGAGTDENPAALVVDGEEIDGEDAPTPGTFIDPDEDQESDATPQAKAVDQAQQDRDDIRAMLASQLKAPEPPSQEVSDLAAERKAIVDEFGEDSPAAKAITKAMERVEALEKADRDRVARAEVQQIVSTMDAAIAKHGLKGYGNPSKRTQDDWKAMESLRVLADSLMTAASRRGSTLSADEAIRRAHVAMNGEDTQAKAEAKVHESIKKQSASRTVPSGRSPVVNKKPDPYADLDPKADDYEARKWLRSQSRA